MIVYNLVNLWRQVDLKPHDGVGLRIQADLDWDDAAVPREWNHLGLLSFPWSTFEIICFRFDEYAWVLY